MARNGDATVPNRRVGGRPLARRTEDLFAGLLRRHIDPYFGQVRLRRLDVAAIRRWHARLTAPAPGPGAVTAAKAYRLLRAICATEVVDEQMARNPCVLPGVGVEHSPERPIATPGQVYALAAAVRARYRALVLLARAAGCCGGETSASPWGDPPPATSAYLTCTSTISLTPGNTPAAATGASTPELMARMGHASARAALIYQHATRDRDVAIAAALSDLVTGAADSTKPGVVPLPATGVGRVPRAGRLVRRAPPPRRQRSSSWADCPGPHSLATAAARWDPRLHSIRRFAEATHRGDQPTT